MKTTDKSTKIAKVTTAMTTTAYAGTKGTTLVTTKASAGTKDTTLVTTTRFRDAMNTKGSITPIGLRGWGPARSRKSDSGG